MTLEDFKERKIEILVQTLGGAQALILPAEPARDARDGRVDLQHLEERHGGRPGMRHHRGHARLEHRLVFGRQRFVDVGKVAFAAPESQPAGGCQHLGAQMVGADAVGGEHEMLGAPAAALQGDAIVESGTSVGEPQRGRLKHAGERKGLQPETVGGALRVSGEMNGDGVVWPGSLLQKKTHERFVGTAQPGPHPGRREASLGVAADFGILEQPGLKPRSAMAAVGKSRQEAIQAPLECLVQQYGHPRPPCTLIDPKAAPHTAAIR